MIDPAADEAFDDELSFISWCALGVGALIAILLAAYA